MGVRTQSTQSARLSFQPSELGSPHPLTHHTSGSPPRVRGFLSSRPNWPPPPPPPHPHESVDHPTPLGPMGETHSLGGEWVGGPDSDEGADTLVLCVYYNPLTVEETCARILEQSRTE